MFLTDWKKRVIFKNVKGCSNSQITISQARVDIFKLVIWDRITFEKLTFLVLFILPLFLNKLSVIILDLCSVNQLIIITSTEDVVFFGGFVCLLVDWFVGRLTQKLLNRFP